MRARPAGGSEFAAAELQSFLEGEGVPPSKAHCAVTTAPMWDRGMEVGVGGSSQPLYSQVKDNCTTEDSSPL